MKPIRLHLPAILLAASLLSLDLQGQPRVQRPSNGPSLILYLASVEPNKRPELGTLIDRLKRNPNDVDSLIRCGVFFMQEAPNHLDSFSNWMAVSKYELARAVSLEPNNFYARHNYGQALFQGGDLKPLEGDAARFNPQAAAERASHPNMRLAVAEFTSAIEINPRSARSYMGRGFAYLMLGDSSNAQQDFDQALRLDPTLRHDLETEAAAISPRKTEIAQCHESSGEEYMRLAITAELKVGTSNLATTVLGSLLPVPKPDSGSDRRFAQFAKAMFTNYEKAAEAGNSTANAKLGEMYEGGRYVPQDFRQAADRYERAAACHFVYAEYRLATFHEQGVVYPKSYEEAAQLFQRAADDGQNSPAGSLNRIVAGDAYSSLALYAWRGRTGPRDVSQAVVLFSKASSLGSSMGTDDHYYAVALRKNPNITDLKQLQAEADKLEAEDDLADRKSRMHARGQLSPEGRAHLGWVINEWDVANGRPCSVGFGPCPGH
jgi:TPR repeat protein